MKKKLDILIADPSGNITIFVLTPFGRMDYQSVANKLLDMKELKGEQVAFIKEPYPGVNGKMEMCGLEFCGNASRSFGLICAINDRKYGKCQSVIDVSGSKENLTVDVDLNNNYAKIQLPQYKSVVYSNEINAAIVEMEGIVHVVLTDENENDERFLEIKKYIISKYNPPAIGVMFYTPSKNELIPFVYVSDVDTTYREGSCGSGSASVAIAMASQNTDGEYTYQLVQPGGAIVASAVKENGIVTKSFIEGIVKISDITTVEIDL